MNTTVELVDALKQIGLQGNEADADWIVSCDVAELNLACAKGLPGSNDLDVEKCLTTLDEWAAHVQREIERHYYRFLQSPEKFNNSQGWFCVLMMITVLQQDFGVRYNPERIRDPDFTNSRDLFLHGLISGEGGTCASMPVLYAAIGRRLGYPIKLVHTRSHVFCRWDDPEGQHSFGASRFNIEGAGIGASSFPDDYYMTWPEPIRTEDIRQGIYLRSLGPKEELASFLASRGHCLLDNQRFGDARIAYCCSGFLAPDDPHYNAFHEDAQQKIDHVTEHRVLWLYFGPNATLPYGAFNRREIYKLQSDMLVAQAEFNNLALESKTQAQPAMAVPNRLNHSEPRVTNPRTSHDAEREFGTFAGLVVKLPFGELQRLDQVLRFDADVGLPLSESSRRSELATGEFGRRHQEAVAHLKAAKVLSQVLSPARLPQYSESFIETLSRTKS